VQSQHQPRTYRIRLFEDGYEHLRDRKFIAVLDFGSGPMLRATEGQLDALAEVLPYQVGARGKKALKFYLAVHDDATDEFYRHWPAKTWVED
jgi:hypothetical protein